MRSGNNHADKQFQGKTLKILNGNISESPIDSRFVD